MYNNSDELVIVLNAVESTCAVEFYTVVDTSRSPVHNTPCPLHWVRDSYFDPDDRDRFINAPELNVHRSAHTPRPSGISRGQFR